MELNQLADNDGARKARTRVGRGAGSGKGKTAGRGMKGQKSRSGVAIKGFEGGQMPLYRRLPKRGFSNPNAKSWAVVNLGRIQEAIGAGKLDPAKTVDGESLLAAGVIRRVRDGVRLLANGSLSQSGLTFKVAGASKAAVAAVSAAGGTVELPPPPVPGTGKRAQRRDVAAEKRAARAAPRQDG